MDVEAGRAPPAQGVHPPGTRPLGGGGDVGHPQRVVPRDPGVHPELAARLEIDGSSPAAAPGQFDAAVAQGGGIHQLRRLGAAEDEGGARDRTGQRHPPGLGTELLDLEECL